MTQIPSTTASADTVPAAASPAIDAPPRIINSIELFAGRRAVIIEHAGQQYRLLITRNDRLILQK
jgi:hemin uptake protein HemP